MEPEISLKALKLDAEADSKNEQTTIANNTDIISADMESDAAEDGEIIELEWGPDLDTYPKRETRYEPRIGEKESDEDYYFEEFDNIDDTEEEILEIDLSMLNQQEETEQGIGALVIEEATEESDQSASRKPLVHTAKQDTKPEPAKPEQAKAKPEAKTKPAPKKLPEQPKPEQPKTESKKLPEQPKPEQAKAKPEAKTKPALKKLSEQPKPEQTKTESKKLPEQPKPEQPKPQPKAKAKPEPQPKQPPKPEESNPTNHRTIFAGAACLALLLICILAGTLLRRPADTANNHQGAQNQLAQNQQTSEAETTSVDETSSTSQADSESQQEERPATEAPATETPATEAPESEQQPPERTPEVTAIAEYRNTADEYLEAGNFSRFKLHAGDFAYAKKGNLMLITVTSTDTKPYTSRYYYEEQKLICFVIEAEEQEKVFYLEDGIILMTEGQLESIEDPDLESVLKDAAYKYKTAKAIVDRY